MIRELEEKDYDVIEENIKEENIIFYKKPLEKHQNVFIYEKNTEKAAFIIYVAFEKDRAEIEYIYVFEKFRRQGIAQRLIEFCLEHITNLGCKSVTLEVRIKNDKAIKLYEKLGFKHSYIRHNYYKNGDDASLMIREMG